MLSYIFSLRGDPAANITHISHTPHITPPHSTHHLHPHTHTYPTHHHIPHTPPPHTPHINILNPHTPHITSCAPSCSLCMACSNWSLGETTLSDEKSSSSSPDTSSPMHRYHVSITTGCGVLMSEQGRSSSTPIQPAHPLTPSVPNPFMVSCVRVCPL